jgi:redox-regulated HSP33 family molecular chaperone
MLEEFHPFMHILLAMRPAKGKTMEALVEVLRSAHSLMDGAAVALGSSAIAEDLLGMAFAGQQNSYLNVIGEEHLLKTVVDCWSSQWTASAICYQACNHMELNRGLLHNPTTEMDLALWQTAQSIQREPAAFAEFQTCVAPELA